MNAETPHAHRYAVYFAPAVESPWWDAGSRWLGRCAATDRALDQPPIEGVDAALLRRLTHEPRRYGWHATLKAPFALAEGVSPADFRSALQALASRFRAFDMPALRARRLGGFLALCPEGNAETIHELAAACVTELHPLVSVLSCAEIERRRRKSLLSTQEDALLVRWGYPYVLKRYRFHMSLTSDLSHLPPETLQCLEQAARERFSGLPPARFDSLALFAEPTPGADFVLLERMGLAV
jgi:putative phosphonate metabolism protein